jgi:hypothetical protein
MTDKSIYNFCVNWVGFPIISMGKFTGKTLKYLAGPLSGNLLGLCIVVILAIGSIKHGRATKDVETLAFCTMILCFILTVLLLFRLTIHLLDYVFDRRYEQFDKEPIFIQNSVLKMGRIFNQFMIDVSKTTEARQAMREDMRIKSQEKREERKAKKIEKLAEANKIKSRSEILDIRKK